MSKVAAKNKKVLLNLSGHPAPKQNGHNIISLPIPQAGPTPRHMRIVASQLISKLEKNPRVAEAIARGEYEVMLPGYAPLASALIAQLAGKSGRLPTVRWCMRRKDRYVLGAPLNLQSERTKARGNRVNLGA